MFDRLDDLLIRYEEVMGELQEPDVANDPERFRRLMKEQSDLAPIVEAYKEFPLYSAYSFYTLYTCLLYTSPSPRDTR